MTRPVVKSGDANRGSHDSTAPSPLSARPRRGGVVGLLHYSVPTEPQPAICSQGPGRPETLRGVADDPRWVRIRDARRIAGRLALDECGFELLHCPSRVTDFANQHQLKEIYESEIAALLQLHTGAREVVVFDPTLRSSKPHASAPGAYREPVLRVHSDFTDRSAAQTLRDLSCEHHVGRSSGRFAILQAWRPLSESADGLPLALADARSVQERDLFRVQRVYPDWVGELGYVTHRPEHRWYWFPGMTRDEAVLFKVYDSAIAGTARWVAHTGFLPLRPTAAAAQRESIEIRALVFF